MFLIESFNKAWESERQKIENSLVKKLSHEIECLEDSAKISDPEHARRIQQLKIELTFRKAMATFESEEIARQRMQLRASYLAVVISSVALCLSVIALYIK